MYVYILIRIQGNLNGFIAELKRSHIYCEIPVIANCDKF